MTDVIADMLTRIRNALIAKHETVEIPASNVKKEIARILLEEGFISGYNVEEEGVQGSHDGMDWLEYEAFFAGIRAGDQPTIDTYDMAAWMAVTPLSEISIAQSGAPVDVPDFTRGAWIDRTDGNHSRYTLDYIN